MTNKKMKIKKIRNVVTNHFPYFHSLIPYNKEKTKKMKKIQKNQNPKRGEIMVEMIAYEQWKYT